ncbi:MAG TPA: MarR family transcriptional regulator [Steroidobacteraceae bacterium]
MPEQHYRPETYRARDSVGYLVRRLYTIWLARFEDVLKRGHMTLTQWIVLIQLRDGIARTASEIAHDLRHDSGALTRVIDQLERRGLVARRRSAQDRRLVELELTDAGQAAVRALVPKVVEQTNAALEPLTREEFQQFRGYLTRILEHVQDSVESSPGSAAPASKSPAAAAARRKRQARPPAPGKAAPRRAARRSRP